MMAPAWVAAGEVLTALGSDLARTWAAWTEGRSAVGPVRGFDASGFGTPRAAQVFVEPQAAEDDPTLRILGPHGQLLEAVLRPVCAGARGVPRTRLGLYAAIGMVDAAMDDLLPAVLAARGEDGRLDLARLFAGAYRSIHPLWPLAMLGNVAVGQIAIDLDVRGDNLVLASEADGGVRALIEGAQALAEGAADEALVACASERLGPAAFARRRLRGDLPPDGTGTPPGEAGAALRLVPVGQDLPRPPLGTFLGGATAFGPAEGWPGPARATIRRALHEAPAATATTPSGVRSVWLDGAPGDLRAAEEQAALQEVLGPDVATASTKAALGHAGAAAPVIDVLLALRALAEAQPPQGARGAPGRAVVLAASSAGAAGALVVEAVP